MPDDLPRFLRRTTLSEDCPHCGKSRHWSSLGPDAVSTPPAGHTVYTTPDGSTYDTCPEDGTLRMPPGDGPLTI